jgi:hypothetical protein
MEIVSLKDDVFVVDNLITEEECQKIIAYFDAITDAGHLKWNQISFYGSLAMGYWPWDDNLLVFGLPKDYFSILKEKVKKAGEICFNRELSEVSYHAQKWVIGAFAGFHSDNTHEDGTPSAFYKSKYAGFLYLNDNFDGGVLNFKHHDIAIKPKPGRLSFWDNADAVYTPEQIAEWEQELKETRAEQEKTYEEWNELKKKGTPPTHKGKYDV